MSNHGLQLILELVMFSNHLMGRSPRVFVGAQDTAGSEAKAAGKPILIGGDSERREGSDHSGFCAENGGEAAGPLLGHPGEK